MAILSDDAVVELVNGPGGEADTIKVDDLKALILATPVLKRYEGQLVNTLDVGGAWMLNNTLSITIQVENNP